MKEKRFFINFFQKFNFQNSQLWTFTLSFANNQLQAYKHISNKLKQLTYFCRDGNVVLRLYLEKVVIYNKKKYYFYIIMLQQLTSLLIGENTIL